MEGEEEQGASRIRMSSLETRGSGVCPALLGPGLPIFPPCVNGSTWLHPPAHSGSHPPVRHGQSLEPGPGWAGARKTLPLSEPPFPQVHV